MKEYCLRPRQGNDKGKWRVAFYLKVDIASRNVTGINNTLNYSAMVGRSRTRLARAISR